MQESRALGQRVDQRVEQRSLRGVSSNGRHAFVRLISRSLVCTACAVTVHVANAAAVERAPKSPVAAGATADSPLWQSGGVTGDERRRMQSEVSRYSLWLVTALKPSGEYLSDVHISIRDAQGALLFDQLLDGPWLMVQLPTGTYHVVATCEGQRLSRRLQLRAGPVKPTYFHFDPQP